MASDAERAKNEGIAGVVGGFICKLAEHPFDTVKVQAQTQSFTAGKPVSPLTLLKTTLSEKGWLFLYRGIPSPLISSMGENLILFAAYGLFNRVVQTGEDEEIPLHKKFLGGAFAGVCVSQVLTPVELVKCRMQTTNQAVRQYKNTLECFVHTTRTEGFRGLYRGHVSTMCREIPGNAAWFGGYEIGVYMLTPVGKSKENMHPARLAAAGAVGGMAYWFFPFPFDVVKSKIQTNTHGLPSGVKPSVTNVLRHVYQTEGIQGLYRGCGLTLMRAAPTNAILFLSYELTFRLLCGHHMLGT